MPRRDSLGHRWLVRLYAVAVLAVPVVFGGAPEPSPVAAEAIQEDRLAGLWSRHELGFEGDPLAFYYFHGDGHGLYRYGRVGYNNTHSFDYAIEGDVLELRFRKTGDTHRIRVRISPEGDKEWLILDADPEADGKPERYFRQRGPVEEGFSPTGDGPLPAGRLWIDYRDYATGGAGFSLYQLRPAGLDGRGVGWFHRGDFDDWSTESLHYRITGDRIEFWFSLSGQHANTGFRLEGKGAERSLFLESDPRDFWHSHRYRDGGRSFGSHANAIPAVASAALGER